MSNKEISSCPFCGDQPYTYKGGYLGYTTQCDCYCGAPDSSNRSCFGMGKSEEDSQAEWNEIVECYADEED